LDIFGKIPFERNTIIYLSSDFPTKVRRNRSKSTFLKTRGKVDPHSMTLNHIEKMFHAKLYVNQRFRNMDLIGNIWNLIGNIWNPILIFRIFENSAWMEVKWITLLIFGFYLFFDPFSLKWPKLGMSSSDRSLWTIVGKPTSIAMTSKRKIFFETKKSWIFWQNSIWKEHNPLPYDFSTEFRRNRSKLTFLSTEAK